ncbi:MAG: spore coat protein [Bacillota bacterium]
MANLLNTLTGNRMNDRDIANDMMMASKGACMAYLAAALESVTPELRSLYTNALTQMVLSHGILTELVAKREWLKPYATPEQQLFEAYHESEIVVQQIKS